LLGSFTVATWSDLKRLSAQREFVEIWLLFTLAMLGHDVWSVHVGGMPQERVGVKWGLIILASILSVSWVGVLFRLAPADVAALAAAASLLSLAKLDVLGWTNAADIGSFHRAPSLRGSSSGRTGSPSHEA
jgi:hypothetical protein